MTDMHITKNYFAQGGKELVIGGKLTFLSGAVVEGAEGLCDLFPGSPAVHIPYLEDSKATSAAALREDYNRLLAALRSSGIMTAKAEEPTGNTGEDGDSE